MIGIKFGDYHSYDDLKLILTDKEIGSPTIKTKTVDVEGADGFIDYTEYFGEVKYNNLKHVFTFESMLPQSQFISQYSSIKSKLHGKRLAIVLDDEPDYYYMGRPHVSSFTNNKNIGIVSITCDCEPYKYKKNETVVTKSVSGSSIITLTNSRKTVVPVITTTASMTIVFGDVSVTINAGTYTVPDIELVEGDNVLTVTGTGNITFTYQEGVL